MPDPEEEGYTVTCREFWPPSRREKPFRRRWTTFETLLSFAWRPKSIEPEQSAQQINLTARQLRKVALILGYRVKEVFPAASACTGISANSAELRNRYKSTFHTSGIGTYNVF